MSRKIIFYDNLTGALTGSRSMFLVPGLTLILLGIVIILMPALLVAMVAGTFIFLGMLFVAIAFKTRRIRKQNPLWRDEFQEPL